MPTRPANVLVAWSAMPRRIRRGLDGLTPRQLTRCDDPDEWSIREYAHHLVEANLIAATIVIAALGKPGTVYDWSWVMPSGDWVKRLGYNRVSIEPGLELLEQLCAYFKRIVRAAPQGLRSPVRLRDEGSGTIERKTVEQVLRDEVEHAGHHLRDIARLRRGMKSRTTRRARP